MCKKLGRTYCSELGSDRSSWSQQAPISKPDWILDCFSDLGKSLNSVFTNDLVQAKFHLATDADSDLRNWFVDHGQNAGGWRLYTHVNSHRDSAFALDPIKSFTKLETSIFERDGYRCRYCDSEVLPRSVFKRASKLLGTDILPLGRTNATRSGYYLMFVATLDHVVPWSLGGRTDESNLVTCCWSCNYGKANFTLEDIGLQNPFRRDPNLSNIDLVREIISASL
jgi:hypothetical protein